MGKIYYICVSKVQTSRDSNEVQHVPQLRTILYKIWSICTVMRNAKNVEIVIQSFLARISFKTTKNKTTMLQAETRGYFKMQITVNNWNTVTNKKHINNAVLDPLDLNWRHM